MVGFFNQPTPQTHSATTTTPAIVEFIDRWHHDALLHSPTAAATVEDEEATGKGAQKQQQQQHTLHRAQTVINGCLRPTPTLLLIGITPSPHLEHLTQSLATSFPDLGLRVKQVNHLSLCYWDDPSDALLDPVSLETRYQHRIQWTNQAADLAQSKIPMLDIPPGTTIENESWDVVLYSILGRDKANGLPYPLQEIKRWTLASVI
ncbi:hypothetical protein BGZ95_004136 [Linnemannia exigua]|uniref:Uncharacterized protein n=1 Tax=Linnemannia exigua TaxID=604196 RepID=A0AAD4DHK1_9FUNG|nr:hypothetical protein BGZ95_004136 [Linnemannia exigua]